MKKTLEVLDEVIAKILNTLVSTKFWVMVVTVAIGAITVIQSGGSIWEAILGALLIISGGTTYSVTKMRQNLEYIRSNAGAGRPPVLPPAISLPTVESAPSAPPLGFGTVVSPPVGVDWTEFWNDVELVAERLQREVPGKQPSFAKYEAIQNVGRLYKVSELDDLYSYARAVYDSCLAWWKEMAGFDYLEALEKGVPKAYQNPSCPTSDLTLWIRSSNNPAALKLCIQEIRNAARKLNQISAMYSWSEKDLEAFWKRYPDDMRTLSYVYNTV
jgi:hypothetical protein